MTPQTAVLMAQYNRGMNQLIFEVAAPPDAAALLAYRAAIFGVMLTVQQADRLRPHHTAYVCS